MKLLFFICQNFSNGVRPALDTSEQAPDAACLPSSTWEENSVFPKLVLRLTSAPWPYPPIMPFPTLCFLGTFPALPFWLESHLPLSSPAVFPRPKWALLLLRLIDLYQHPCTTLGHPTSSTTPSDSPHWSWTLHIWTHPSSHGKIWIYTVWFSHLRLTYSVLASAFPGRTYETTGISF